MRKIIIVLIAMAILGVGWFVWHGHGKKSAPNSASSTAQSQATASASFDKTKYSLSDPASIWVVVNKQRQLQPKEYAPSTLRAPNIPLRLTTKDSEMLLRSDAATALESIAKTAKSEAGLQLMLSSGYRSYSFQVNLYNRYVSQQGQASADAQSARPGYSEHQTGLAADLEPVSRTCEVEQCFGNTPEGKWLAANAYRFGFIIRYTQNKTSVTGYDYEPWHVRYVGTDLSQQMHQQGIETLEEFFGLPAAPDYK
jgi:D-alanyl-D-alanine carboxypeptidase